METICESYRTIWERSPFGNMSVICSWREMVDEFLEAKGQKLNGLQMSPLRRTGRHLGVATLGSPPWGRHLGATTCVAFAMQVEAEIQGSNLVNQIQWESLGLHGSIRRQIGCS
ncbi:hypothetical protein MMC31_003718 [Peltigera leucophlebia]|nr:hypothetical protein [Peltigera leucophlebia]